MGYPAGVIAVWDMENSRVDSINSYTLTANNSGGAFRTSSPSPAFGAYSYYTYLTNNFDKIPAAPQITLGAASAWTMEWRQWLRTKDTDTSAFSYAMGLSRGGNDGGAGNLFMRTLTNTWNPGIGDMDMRLNGNYYNIGTWSATLYPDGAVGNRWCRITLCYTSAGQYKLYFDGVLIFSSATGLSNMFATDYNSSFEIGTLCGTDYGSYVVEGMDRLIFATYNSGGAGIVSAPDGATMVGTSKIAKSAFSSKSCGGAI